MILHFRSVNIFILNFNIEVSEKMMGLKEFIIKGLAYTTNQSHV